jgi:cysteinyl-tRNA synthetase
MDLRAMDSAARRLSRMRKLAEAVVGSRKALGEPVPPGFKSAMDDDFDTPRAVDAVERTLKAANRTGDRSGRVDLVSSAATALSLLGVNLVGYPK